MLRLHSPTSAEDEAAVTRAMDCAFAVHRELGPGYRERIYKTAFCLELESRGLRFETEKPVLVTYRQWKIPGQRIDLIVEGRVLVEIKAVPSIRGLHEMQVVSYLRTTGLRVGLLINFNTRLLKHGLKRIVR